MHQSLTYLNALKFNYTDHFQVLVEVVFKCTLKQNSVHFDNRLSACVFCMCFKITFLILRDGFFLVSLICYCCRQKKQNKIKYLRIMF